MIKQHDCVRRWNKTEKIKNKEKEIAWLKM